MFNEDQLKILDQIDPYIDSEEGESRKGLAQSYPVIHITNNQCVWCENTESMVDIPSELLGDWIVDGLFDINYYNTWESLRNQNWVRAEYAEVTQMKWKAK